MTRQNLFVLVVLCGFAIRSFAQTTGVPKLTVGLETGSPFNATGSPITTNLSSFILGGSLKIEYPLTTNFYLIASTDYLYFAYNSEGKEFAHAVEYEHGTAYAPDLALARSGDGFFAIMIGTKYYFSNFYAEAQAGIIATNGNFYGKSGSIAFSPGIGYNFGERIDLGVRYEGWTEDSILYSMAVLRLAYSFKIQ